MGDLPGHVMPGSIFILFAVWYTVRMFAKYFASRQKNVRFTSQLMMDNPFMCGRLKTLPLEGFVKIGLVVLALGFEINTVVNIARNSGKDMAFAYGMHLAMYIFFGISGIVDLLTFYKSHLPKDLDYFAYALAFAVEGILLGVHLHGRSELDVGIHKLLVAVCVLTSITIFVEMFFRHNYLAAFVRNYLILLQGTWFCQVGFILYRPVLYDWKQDDSKHVMIATLLFTVHCAMALVGMMMTGLVMSFCYRSGKGFDSKDELPAEKLHTSKNGQSMIPLIGNSDSDDEFQTHT